jgi:hypothetical protein
MLRKTYTEVYAVRNIRLIYGKKEKSVYDNGLCFFPEILFCSSEGTETEQRSIG